MAVAAVMAVGVGYSIYAGEKSRKMQKEAMRKQEAAQVKAERHAQAVERRNMMESQRARSKKADVESLLAAAQNTGGNPTILTGQRGISSSMLGE